MAYGVRSAVTGRGSQEASSAHGVASPESKRSSGGIPGTSNQSNLAAMEG
jgi:hypothetical protein